jgi:RNA polymerase sigma-70 factor (sigma-E family)
MESLRGAPARREFERFATEATAGLLRTGYLVTSDLAEAEDLVQETLLRTAKRWPSVRKMDYPLAYARRILVNLALRGAHQRARTDAELNVTDITPLEMREDQRVEQNLIAVDTRSEVLWMLAKLPRRQRVVIVLRYFEDLSEIEIAEQLKWPIGTVKSTTSRALEQLRQMIEESPANDVAQLRRQIPLRKGASHDQPT